MSFFKQLFRRTEKEKIKKESVLNNQHSQKKARDGNDNETAKAVRILPRIKVDYSHEIYAADQSKGFTGNPLPRGLEIPVDQQPIIKPLFEDLLLSFAEDQGTSYKILQNEILEKNPNLDLDILYKVSVNALIDEIGEQVKINGDPDHILMVTAGGNFEATLLLLDSFWEQIHQIVNGNVIISIPARDLLFICKEGNQEALEKLREITKGYFDRPDTKGLLSKALYLKEKGKKQFRIVEKTF